MNFKKNFIVVVGMFAFAAAAMTEEMIVPEGFRRPIHFTGILPTGRIHPSLLQLRIPSVALKTGLGRLFADRNQPMPAQQFDGNLWNNEIILPNFFLAPSFFIKICPKARKYFEIFAKNLYKKPVILNNQFFQIAQDTSRRKDEPIRIGADILNYFYAKATGQDYTPLMQIELPLEPQFWPEITSFNLKWIFSKRSNFRECLEFCSIEDVENLSDRAVFLFNGRNSAWLLLRVFFTSLYINAGMENIDFGNLQELMLNLDYFKDKIEEIVQNLGGEKFLSNLIIPNFAPNYFLSALISISM
ncbi:hypothetical protein FACS1894113_4690 [Alphaproteobacteria bacterium]|nr:hypothetical protein FACS1894113_4690 [Alphaproteobacteria bacterium]